MMYRVQTAAIDRLEEGDQFQLISHWVEAENHCHAAVLFMLAADEIAPTNFKREYLDPILVVEKDTYVMGTYKHEGTMVAADYEVGLRE